MIRKVLLTDALLSMSVRAYVILLTTPTHMKSDFVHHHTFNTLENFARFSLLCDEWDLTMTFLPLLYYYVCFVVDFIWDRTDTPSLYNWFIHICILDFFFGFQHKHTQYIFRSTIADRLAIYLPSKIYIYNSLFYCVLLIHRSCRFPQTSWNVVVFSPHRLFHPKLHLHFQSWFSLRICMELICIYACVFALYHMLLKQWNSKFPFGVFFSSFMQT